MPVVSVIMVFHRLSPFMGIAVDSVLKQTFGDLELILVDNGTALGPEAFGIAGDERRVRFVRLSSNEGIPGGHNAGIAAAKGEYVVLLDYDDVALPTRVEKLVDALKEEPALGLVSSCAERIDEHGRLLGREFSLLDPAEQREYTRFATPVVTPAYAGRREVFARFPYRPEFPLAADFDFLGRAAEFWPMRGVPEVLLNYRWHPTQTTQQKAAEIERTLCAIRLLTARRRAGRDENFGPTVDWLKTETPSRERSCYQCVELCLRERFPVLGAYHARRVFVLDRSAKSFATSLRLGLRALSMARGSEKNQAARIYFMGPVKALRLRPA